MDFREAEPSTSNGDESSALSLKSGRTVVQYYGADTNQCGYCKRDPNPEDSFSGRSSYDMQAETITANDYKELLDRGWRRSGNYCYHPINHKTCCPNYPVICDSVGFILSGSQRRCIRNLNSFLIGDNDIKLNYGNKAKIGHKSWDTLKTSAKAKDKRLVKSIMRKVEKYGLSLNEAIKQSELKKSTRMPTKASLEDYLFPKKSCLATGAVFKPKHKLEFTVHHVESKRAVSMRLDENKLIQKYQKTVHGEDFSKWDMTRYCDFLINSPIITERINNFKHFESEDTGDNLVESVSGKENYLLASPPALPNSYGTYHCVYMLDGEMIAVGVLDILPKCITTVYFFYNPDYGHLNLGIYSALVEISMVRRMSEYYNDPRSDSRITHYYLGYYVHECKKMRYKTTFKPSYLLCSETLQYIPTEFCLKKLKDRKYARFCDDCHNKFNINTDLSSLKHFWKIPVITPVTESTSILDYFSWLNTNFGPGYDDLLLNYFLVQYTRLIGVELMQRIYLKLESIHQALKHRHRKLGENAAKSESK